MRIPTYDKPTVKDSGQGTEYVQFARQSNVGAVGQATQQLGGSLQNTGALAMQFAEQRQKEDDTASAYDTYHKMSLWDAETLDGDDGLMREAGVNASGLADRYQELHKEQFSELTKDMTGGAKALFQRLASRSFSANISKIGKHEATQRQEYLKQAASAAATAATNEYISTLDPESFETAIALIDGAVDQSMQGSDPVAKQNKKIELISGMHNQVLDTMVDDSASAAKAYLEEHSEEMTPQDIAVVKKKLETADKTERVQTYANNIDYANVSQTEALATMRDTLDPEDQKQAAQEIKTRYTEIKNAKIELDIQNFDDALSVINDGGTPTATQYASLNEKDERTIRGYAANMRKGVEVKTDFAVWNGVTRMPESDFKKLNLNQYINQISTTDLKALRKDQIELQNGKSFTETSIMAPSANARNYLKNKKIKIDSDDGIEFVRQAQEEITRTEREQGKKIDSEGLTKIYDRLMQGVTVDARLWNKDKELFKVNDKDRIIIPEAFRSGMIARLEARGIPVTEDAIQIYYRAELNK